MNNSSINVTKNEKKAALATWLDFFSLCVTEHEAYCQFSEVFH